MSETIDDNDALLRRVADRPGDLWSRQDDGTIRPTSVAFKPHPDDNKVSVELRRLLADPTNPMTALDQYPEHGLVELVAAI
mgnify:CR=1 FL=1